MTFKSLNPISTFSLVLQQNIIPNIVLKVKTCHRYHGGNPLALLLTFFMRCQRNKYILYSSFTPNVDC